MRKILMLLAATGLLGACTSDEEAQQKGPVPIRLTASVNSTAMTRSIDQQGVAHTVVTRGVQETVLTNGEKVYVWGKEGSSSSWTALQAWELTSDGSGGLSGTTKYYPLDGSTLTMVAVHGNFAESLTEGSTAIGTLTHSVETDQNTTGNYEKSDLLWGTATGSDGDATLNIPFIHKLSKIEVNLTPGYGYTADDLTTAEVYLYNVLPSVTIDPSDGTLGAASGDADTITMRKISTGSFEAVIPSQTFANPDAVIAVTATNLTSTSPATITSTIPNTVATFAENIKYVYNVTLDKLLLDPSNNPLWWVAQYNLAQNKTSFVAAHSTTSQYVFTFSDANQNVSVSGYHLPTFVEHVSIMPCDQTSSTGTIISNLSETLSSPKEFHEVACTVGGSSVSANTSVIGKNAEDDYYAVRFIGTDYASAWHYKWITSPYNGVLIESYLISCASVADAKTILADLATSTIFTGSYPAGAANQTPESTTATISGFCQRFLPACGYRFNSYNGGSGTADYGIETYGYYWSAVEAPNGTSGWSWSASRGDLREYWSKQIYGCSVRLFKDY